MTNQKAKHWNLFVWRLILILWFLMVPLQNAFAEKDIYLLLDNSGSMKSNCNPTCSPCKRNADCLRAGQVCGKNLRCRYTKEAKAEVCADIWEPVKKRTKLYIKQLQPGNRLHFFTFDKSGENLKPINFNIKNNTIKANNKEIISKAIDNIKAEANCTRIYDIFWQLADKMEEDFARNAVDQLLWVFTDGDDDVSQEHSGKHIAKRFKDIAKVGQFSWTLIKPQEALQELCNNKDGKKNNCRSYSTEDLNNPAKKWQITATHQLEKSNISLGKTEISGKLSLSYYKGIMPFSLDVQFHHKDPENASWLTFLGPNHLDDNSDSILTTHWQFNPDLSHLRPRKIEGVLRLVVESGLVKIDKPDIPVNIVVELANYANFHVLSSSSFSTISGQRLNIRLPQSLWYMLSSTKGFDTFRWNRVLREKSPDLSLNPAEISISTGPVKNGQFPVKLKGRKPVTEPQQGLLRFRFVDKNQWLQFGAVDVPVSLQPFRSPPAQIIPSETKEGDKTPAWLYGLAAFLFLIMVLYILLRRRTPTIVLVRRDVEMRLDGGLLIFSSSPLSFGRPKPVSIALADLANLEDEFSTSPLLSNSDISSDDEINPQEQVGIHLPIDMKLTFYMEKNGTIFLDAPYPILADENFPNQPLNKCIKIGRVVDGSLISANLFRILREGTLMQLAEQKKT